MSIIQAAGAGEAATAFYSFEISNSLRFNDDDSAFLSRTPSTTSGSSRQTFTFSCWLKKGVGGFETVFRANLTSNNFDAIQFTSDNQIRLFGHPDNTNINCTTDAVLTDPSAWYNVIFAVDTTQSTESNRVKIYVNGTLQSLSTPTYPSHNLELNINNTTVHHLSGEGSFDGYMAEVNFIDGTALDKDSFGETKENIWIPKDTSGLYASAGANSFRLQFKNSSVGSASSSTVGADTSGKNNHFASSNIATTDNMTDSPTDNHATMNPAANTFFNGTFSDGNLQISPSSVTFATSTIGMTSGKYYAEVEFEANSAAQMLAGITRVAPVANGDNLGSKDGQIGYYNISGNKLVNGGTGSGGNAYGATYTVGDIIGIAVNMDDGEIEFFKNNASQGTITGAIDTTKTYFFASSDFSSANNNTMIWNYGANAFTYTPPSGFEKLSTANLPNPAIDPAKGENPTEYWDAQLYTGDSGTQEISKFAFQPDWVWIKNRDNADDHYMYDSIRGATKTLHPNDTPKEFTSANALQSFDSDGFTTGGDGGTNRNTQDYVAWAWRAGGAPTADNSAGAGNTPTAGSVKIDGSNLGSALAGTIAATRISANTEAGFSIVSYTGTGANATVAHGLNAVPEWIIFRDRDNINDWGVYHVGLGNTNFVKLNETIASTDDDTIFNDTTPTSSVFSLGSANLANNSSQKHIAYCFAPKEGYSKFGIYDDSVVGSDYENTSPFVYTGFRVGWLMIKGTSAGREWVMYDNKRTPDNGVYLRSNTAATEQTDATNHDISFLSNGFKIRGGSGDINTTGESYIYMAFADQPFKFANGGTE